jgi:hypothetical protein
MEARTPEKVHPLWVQAHNMGDLDGMMALCEPEVCFITWSGHSVTGTDAVLDASPNLIAVRPIAQLLIGADRWLTYARHDHSTWRYTARLDGM